MSDPNPYQSSDTLIDTESPRPAMLKFGHILMYSYGMSLATAFAVAAIWLIVVHGITPLPTRDTPDVAKWGFLFATTHPSVLTCLCFTVCYCTLVTQQKDRRIWAALLFGFLSGLTFNAMNAIAVIEYFFDW